MSNREFTATRTMLANAFATAGAELLDYMGTAAALAAIPNTDPPRYVVAGTLAMIAKVLPSANAPAAATVLTDERIIEIRNAVGQRYNSTAHMSKSGAVEFARAIEREVIAQAGKAVTDWADAWDRAHSFYKDDRIEFNGAYQAMIDAAPTIPAQVPAAEVRAAYEQAAREVEKRFIGYRGVDADLREIANSIRALAAPSTADSANTGTLGEGADRG